ncbi:nuclear GTP-binding protein [Acrasis kona]|uniref:Nuclear GTP-binding protein n=1 Tax=Acrasis kona TaxID=1008807 RepID=A0AAW2YYY4_9EUKA
MVSKPTKSKRKTLNQKYKVFRKVRDHKKKLRKAGKGNTLHKPRLKKDPGIPNLWPFKQEILEKIAENREKQKEEAENKKVKKGEEKDRQLRQAEKQNEMARLMFEASRRGTEFEAKEELIEANKSPDGFKDLHSQSLSSASKKAYYREFKKVVEQSDVIIEVLDARDPIGCRCIDIEKNIMSNNPDKKIVLLLNKIDLVPREVVSKWLAYLRHDYPTVAFKSNTQHQKGNLARHTSGDDGCLGADTLIQLLKNYCRNDDVKVNISVGIIGYPNVGKSSLINSLKRTKVVQVGNKPGLTKNAQEIHLDKNIKLLDCPGIIFSSGQMDADIILRNAVRIEQLDDAVTPVGAILKRCKPERLMERYGVHEFKTTEEFLTQIAKLRGKIKKGGSPNLEAAGRIVLQDWNDGRIPFYTLPPKREDAIDEFNRMNTDDDAVLNKLNSLADSKDYVPMLSGQAPTVEITVDSDDEGDEGDDQDMDDDDDEDEEEDSDVEVDSD